MIRDFLAPLMDAWVLSWNRLPDKFRSIPALARTLTTRGNTFIPYGRNWICLTMQGELAANVVVLGNGDAVQLRRLLKSEMEQRELQRLSALVPVGATDYYQLLRQVGFRKEGTVRQTTIYDGKITDAHLMGFLLTDRKGRRRKRRSRRAT